MKRTRHAPPKDVTFYCGVCGRSETFQSIEDAQRAGWHRKGGPRGSWHCPDKH